MLKQNIECTIQVNSSEIEVNTFKHCIVCTAMAKNVYKNKICTITGVILKNLLANTKYRSSLINNKSSK